MSILISDGTWLLKSIILIHKIIDHGRTIDVALALTMQTYNLGSVWEMSIEFRVELFFDEFALQLF